MGNLSDAHFMAMPRNRTYMSNKELRKYFKGGEGAQETCNPGSSSV